VISAAKVVILVETTKFLGKFFNYLFCYAKKESFVNVFEGTFYFVEIFQIASKWPKFP